MNLCDSVIVWINNPSPWLIGEFLSGHIELLAAPCGLLCVWLAIRQNIWCYPVGLVQAALYIWIFLHAGLYSNTILNVIFVALQVNGWVHWRRSDLKTDTLRVSRLGRSGIVACTAVGLLGTISVGSFMNAFTDTALPVWDAAIMVLSLIAQFLFARKILENWLVWIGVDVLGIGVYAMNHLYVTTVLYSVFLCMAVAGWIEWQRSIRKEQAQMHSGEARDLSSQGAFFQV